MFKFSDDISIDEDFLSGAFDIPNTNNESNKRNIDPLNDQPVKKVCTQSPDNITKNILSIIKSKSQTTADTFTSNPLSKPNTPIISNKSLKHKNYTTLNHSNEKNRRVVQRKFPGPAGILPEQKQLNINIKTIEKCDTSVNNKTLESDEIVCSQLFEDIFKKEPWMKMLTDWGTISKRISLPHKYTISWTKSKAIAKKLIGQKTPFLAAVIQTVDGSSKDPMILLKDKTGDIQATLLHEVWEEYCDYLFPGSVIVLRQVGVLSTLKKHYLAITLNNLVAIYSEEENKEEGKTVETINIQETTVEEFIKTIENTKQSYETQKILQKLQPSFNNPYFKKQNNVQQKSPETRANKPINQNDKNTNKEVNKFNFKAKTVINIEQNTENKQCSTSNSLIPTAEEESIILTQVFDGVDTDSLFAEF